MAFIEPPVYTSFTADNVSGANLTPQSDAHKLVIYEQNQAATDDYTVTIAGVSAQRPAGSRTELVRRHGMNWKSGVATGILVKRAGVGSLNFMMEEQGE